MASWTWLFGLLWLLACGVGVGEAKRPELIGSSVWYAPNATLLNVNFDAALVQMDFDQPLYTNGHTFLCPQSDSECPELTCKACDWSGQEPTGCDDPTCCGPAQSGDMDKAQEWCDRDVPEYKTLKFGETSERFTLQQDELMYVRFFVPEEYYCRPINVIPRPYYGVPSASFSTIEPFPSFSTNTGWRNQLNRRTFGFGQTSLMICPNTTLHPEYNVGTFSGMFYGIIATSFEVELLVSPDAHPLALPDNRISCDDVPEDVMNFAGAHDPAFCIEDGETLVFTADDTEPSSNLLSLVVPVPKGCHTLSFTSASEIPTSPSISHHKFCLPSIVGLERSISNAGMFRISAEGEGMVLTACFEEEVTYMICSLRIYRPEPVHFTFSSVAPVVRKNLLELPDASLAMMDGLQHAWSVTFGKEKYPCIDHYAVCFDWLVTPSDDTLYLYPPPASPRLDTEQVFEDIQEIYRQSGIQTKKENRLSFTLIFKSGTTVPVVKNLTSLSLVVTAVTNEDGEVVNLPGGGIDTNPEDMQQYSMSKFVSHIPLSEIPEFEYPPCDFDRYSTYQELVQERLDEVRTEKNLPNVLSLKYSLDTMNEGVLAQSCTTQVADNLDTYVTEVEIKDSDDCIYPFGSLGYWTTPCCNVFISHIACCTPFDMNATETPYGDVADVSDCGESECAQSYYEDLSFSLNHFDDVQLGCTSGIKNPTSSFARDLVEATYPLYVSCLEKVGFGDVYQGVSCQVDSDCEHVLGVCYKGICALPALDELEAQFLQCYIDNMTSSLEYYLKRNVLPDTVYDESKNSPEFYAALMNAATRPDCVSPTDPLAISSRTRYQVIPSDYACTATELGFVWPDQAEETTQACPGQSILRSYGVSLNASSCIYLCFDWTFQYIEATREDCPTNEKCIIDIDDCDDEDDFYCVYCPASGDSQCQHLPEFTTQEECEAAVACELPDGTVDFSLTEEECSQRGTGCTTDCVGNSCESILNLEGACFVPSVNSSSDCSGYATRNTVTSEWYDDECVLNLVSSQAECSALPSTEWVTCQGFDETACSGDTTQQKYMGCYVSLWHECPNKEECEDSGKCTDRDLYTIIHDYEPVDIQYGVCIGSGEYVAETKPSCGSTVLYETCIIGCRAFTIKDPAECTNPSFFIFAQWINPAMTKDVCLSQEIGRSGCRVYKDPVDILLWITDDEECDCRGGGVLNAWEWIPGVWEGGVPRSLEWKQAEKKPTHEFKDSLSFILLAEWIRESTQEQFLYPLQSQIICESESITSPVFTLVCDCLADGGEVCYDPGEEQKEIQMGLSAVCEGETTFVKDPSAQVSFGTNSVSEGCSFLNISIIYRNWFAAPFTAPPLSFKWEEPKERGVVINQKEATVGEVLGDGLVLTFSDPSVIEEFDVCLRLTTEGGEYNVRDFGYTTEELENIYPLGLSIKQRDGDGEEDGGIWYCGSFDFQKSPTKSEGAIRLFPINRLENYEDEEDEYVSRSTKGLCYTLGALYCILGLFSLIAVFLYAKQIITMNKSKAVQLPLFCTATFFILCVFRACFMFLYPTGTFEYEPLAYFIVFEIPTFLLFSVLIFMIYSFKRLVYKKGFFPGNPTPILIIGWSLVWSMWVIVTIVYSEVILEDSSGTSPCEGRVEKSYDDEEEDTRNLAIAYQSVIICVTFFLTAVFFYYTYQIYSTTKSKKSGLKQFIIVVGGSFNVAFFVRTVLFLIILVADFASAAYLFVTLLLTEVLMMTFLLVQFNIRYFRAIASAVTESTTFGSNSGTNSSHLS